ncbi:MAG TPA: 5'-deoxyadenosine deaminase [Vicinamibacterales bacterium]|nr:5'-deoxyadenosine deaminase [Vicinamibacterales bacterium]
MSLLVRNAIILTMNDALDVIEGDVWIQDGRIAAVGDVGNASADQVINAGGGYLLPGFVQTHVHLCQTLFRGYADDLALLEWLRERIWPMEAAHVPASLAAAARLAAAELLLGGTTCVLTMETVHDTEAVFEALEPTGLRAVVGKCMMDADDAVPKRLLENTARSIDESLALAARWHGRANGRLRAAFAPRFAVSCSRELLEAVGALSRERGLLVHTHASENRDEIALVRSRTGQGNVAYLDHVGLASPRLCLAHCVWVDDAEQTLLATRDVKVLHCPGSNLKLASGIAPVTAMRARGISVSLGADGAACNNQLDMFTEMRLAAGLQAITHGAGALRARDVLWMATREGARALGMESEIGAIERGKRADLIIIDRDRPHLATAPDPISAVVYAARPSDVRTTIVDGAVLVDEHRLVRADTMALAVEARQQAVALAARAF